MSAGPGMSERDVCSVLLEENPAAYSSAIERLAEAGAEAVRYVVRRAAMEHLLLRTLRRLSIAGVDLAAHSMDPELARSARVTSYLRHFAAADAPLQLALVLESLERHAELLHALIADLGQRHPGEVTAVYGMGLRLAFAAGVDRQSSDIDFYVRSPEVAASIRDYLEHERGYQFWGSTAGVAVGADLETWTLVGMEGDHAMHVDCFTKGRPSAGHQWIPPFRGEGMLARSVAVTTPGGEVRVPSPEDMLLMAAEKVQRKGDFSLRRIVDTGTVLRSSPDLDWAVLNRGARTFQLLLGLDWMLRAAVEHRLAPVPADALQRTRPASWERAFQAVIAGRGPRSRRARSLHRLVWVGRYVVHHDHPVGAAREIKAGRFTAVEKPAGVETWGR